MMTGMLLLVANPQLHLPSNITTQVRAPISAPVAAGAPGPAIASPPPSSVGSPPVTAPVEPVKDEWPADEIARGREQCMHLLTGVAADIEYLEPIKKGPCGLPAPVALKSVGSDESKVVFDPPVHVNCRMVAALGKWVKSTLQPAARQRLKSEVVRIVGASGYSCRNIYNLPDAKLSQHALANAVDIGGFGLANGHTVRVLQGWGLTARDIKAQKAKALVEAKAAKTGRSKKGAAEAQEAKATAADVESASAGKAGRIDKKGSAVTQASLTPSGLKLQKKSIAADAPEDKAAVTATAAAGKPAKPTNEALFLRAIHGGACGAFGTVLGPEANDPHRNHFHLDLIPRRGRGYCE